MLGMVLLGSLFLTRTLVAERPQFGELPFAFLGAGFMLVETKAITELGLTFGNTWQVIGIVIAGVLIMAFLANAAVHRFDLRRPHAAYVLLLVSLAAGWFVSRAGGFPPTLAGRIASAALLTSPLFFSGIVFSTLLGTRGPLPRSWRPTCSAPWRVDCSNTTPCISASDFSTCSRWRSTRSPGHRRW